MAKVGFVGLGVMEGPMARHLAAAGHDVAVYNPNPRRAEAWITALVDQFYGEVQAVGGNRQDGSSLLRRYER